MEGTTAQQGIKRKRYEPPPQDIGVKIAGKLHHDLKEVKKAAKKAKTFETQKLIKKLKDLRKKTETADEIAEVEGQLELLKDLDHELIATTALKTKLNKPVSKELTANVSPVAPGTAAAKVQSRLLSSKILATEVATVVEDLKNVLQPKVTPVDADIADDEPITKRPKKSKKADTAKEKVPAKVSQAVVGSQGDGDDDVLEEEEIDDEGWESGTVDDDEQEPQDGWESGSISGVGEDDAAEESDDDEEELAVAPSTSKKAPPLKAPLTKAPPKTTGLQSTFLPSLSVGFTRGESDDSDLSESEIKVADIDIKKNRRGQRARRAIWEKKFGSGANHKKKEAEDYKASLVRGSQGRPSNGTTPFNRQPIKGPAGRQSNTNMPQHRQEADKGWGQRTAPVVSVPQRSAPPARSSARGRVEEKPMHPSWEAKRKLKEKEGASIVPSLGKKIKFS
ncbi:Bud-site selection protein [Lyophyllum atratum]|nr:Bud-site selection protein [Lyophyllum atratum]